MTRVIGSARPSVRGVAVSEEGIPVRRATVTVTDVATSLPAVIYSDPALTTTTANPMTTNADGVYEFWVPDGTYSLAYAGLARMPAPEQVAVVSGFSAPPGTYAPLAALVAEPDLMIFGTITRDANGAATAAAVMWPDGTPGTYTADTLSTAFPGSVDAYHVTYGSPATRTYTQPTVTRDASTGAVSIRPALVVT